MAEHGDLLAVLAHEWVNSSASISVLGQLLLRYEDELAPDQRREFVELIIGESQKLTETFTNVARFGLPSTPIVLDDVVILTEDTPQTARV